MLNTTRPLTPAVPALAVWITIEPELVIVLYPVVANTVPPEADVLVPAERMSSPPIPLFPIPTDT